MRKDKLNREKKRELKHFEGMSSFSYFERERKKDINNRTNEQKTNDYVPERKRRREMLS